MPLTNFVRFMNRLTVVGEHDIVTHTNNMSRFPLPRIISKSFPEFYKLTAHNVSPDRTFIEWQLYTTSSLRRCYFKTKPTSGHHVDHLIFRGTLQFTY